jgi:hypothetical protein
MSAEKRAMNSNDLALFVNLPFCKKLIFERFMSNSKDSSSKPKLNLTRNKPYADWKEERLHLRNKWGNQGSKVEPPKKKDSES